MKKFFTLLSAVLFFVGLANAQERKSWDFTKGTSSATAEQLDNPNSGWNATVNGEGITTNWVSNKVFANEQLTANGQVIKEFEGLYFTSKKDANAVNYMITKVRLQKECSFVLADLKKGSTLKIVAQSANATATNRGILWEEDLELTSGPEDGIILGRDAEGAPEGGQTIFTFDVLGDAPKISTNSTAGIEILSITIDDGRGVKTWDFTSWSTAEDICADAEGWTNDEKGAGSPYVDGNQIRWNLTTDMTAVPEFDGLNIASATRSLALAFDYQTCMDANKWGPYNGASYLWLCGNATKITIPEVPAGSKIVVGVESHKPGEARGVNVQVDGATVGTLTSIEYAELSCDLETEEAKDVTLVCTKGCHVYKVEVVYPEGYIPGVVAESTDPDLGIPSFSLKSGARIKPTGLQSISMKFPKAKNLPEYYEIEAEATIAGGENSWNIVIAGGSDSEIEWVNEDEITLEELTDYTFSINKITVYDAEGLDILTEEPAEGEDNIYELSFGTTGPAITEPRSWELTTTVETAEAIAQGINSGLNYWAASSKGRYSVKTPISSSELMINDTDKFPNTEGLYFTMNSANDILVGTPTHEGVDANTSAGGNNGYIQLGGGSPKITIPSCAAGDEIIIKALWSTSNQGNITLGNATYNGETAMQVTGSAASYSFIVTEDGDVDLTSKAVKYASISILPAGYQKQEFQYTINAVDQDGNVLKEFENGSVEEGTTVKNAYNHFLKTAEGNLVEASATNKEYNYAFDITESKDYNITYKTLEQAGIIYLSEGEDIEGTILCTGANAAVRCSNSKASYVEQDIKVTTLPAGRYRIGALTFDANKSFGKQFLFTAGEQKIVIKAEGENSALTYSAEFELTEATDLIWAVEGTVEGAEGEAPISVIIGGANQGIDALWIQDMNVQEEAYPTAIKNVNAAAANVVVKAISNGRLVIKSAKGVYTVSGAKIK